MRGIFVLLVFFGLHFFGWSQKLFSDQNHAWVTYFGNHKLSSKWGIHTEYQWRRADMFKNWQQSLLRLGADYYLPNKDLITVGYGWIKTFRYGEQPIIHHFNEHRIWQQYLFQRTLWRFNWQHRYRLEQRFLENWKTQTGEFYKTTPLFRQRFRYRMMFSLPLFGKEMTDNQLFLAIYNEIFLGFGKGIGKNVLDQNRFYTAIGWRFNKDVNLQVGYLNQYIIKSDGVNTERNHTLQLSLTYNLNFIRKQE